MALFFNNNKYWKWVSFKPRFNCVHVKLKSMFSCVAAESYLSFLQEIIVDTFPLNEFFFRKIKGNNKLTCIDFKAVFDL